MGSRSLNCVGGPCLGSSLGQPWRLGAWAKAEKGPSAGPRAGLERARAHFSPATLPGLRATSFSSGLHVKCLLPAPAWKLGEGRACTFNTASPIHAPGAGLGTLGRCGHGGHGSTLVPLTGEHPRASPWLRLPTPLWSLSLPALSQSVLACHPSTGCGKSRLGAGPSFAQGAQVGGFLLLLTWPQTTPPALYLMWQGCCCPQGVHTGPPAPHFCPSRQMGPPQGSEAPLILGLPCGLSVPRPPGVPRAEADGCSRYVCSALRDQEATGHPAGGQGLCSPDSGQLHSRSCFHFTHLPGELG